MSDDTVLHPTTEFVDIMQSHIMVLRKHFYEMADLATHDGSFSQIDDLLKRHIKEYHRFTESIMLVGILVASELNESG